ncbi:hypothetical protein QQ045_016548 [Rhodiola kirilowii]
MMEMTFLDPRSDKKFKVVLELGAVFVFVDVFEQRKSIYQTEKEFVPYPSHM